MLVDFKIKYKKGYYYLLKNNFRKKIWCGVCKEVRWLMDNLNIKLSIFFWIILIINI